MEPRVKEVSLGVSVVAHGEAIHTLWHLRNLGRSVSRSWPADLFPFGRLAVGYISCSQGVVAESTGENQERRSCTVWIGTSTLSWVVKITTKRFK